MCRTIEFHIKIWFFTDFLIWVIHIEIWNLKENCNRIVSYQDMNLNRANALHYTKLWTIYELFNLLLIFVLRSGRIESRKGRQAKVQTEYITTETNRQKEVITWARWQNWIVSPESTAHGAATTWKLPSLRTDGVPSRSGQSATPWQAARWTAHFTKTDCGGRWRAMARDG